MRLRRSRLTDEQTRRLLEHFVAGTPARTAAELVGVNRNTSRVFYHRMREIIAQHLAGESPLPGAVAIHAPALSPQPRGNPPGAKIPVFGLVKRGHKVHTVMMADAPSGEPAAPSALELDSIVYGTPAGREHVVDVSTFQYHRVPRRARIAPVRTNISNIENFWNQTKRQLRRYKGVPQRHFHLFLKECEWRYNYGPPNQLLRMLKDWVRTSRD